MRKKLLNVIFWSVVSAAFIGPGTVTTASQAGAMYKFDLLWALVFSTFACLLLQEASVRVTLYSGMNLGQAIAKQFEGRSSRMFVLVLIIGAIIVGSAAYEAGNVLGSTAGLALFFDYTPEETIMMIVGATGVLAFLVLSLPSPRQIAKVMGTLVILMGMTFLFTAVYLDPPIDKILKGSFVPSIPYGSGVFILGLIGTTVVPYDIFLSSGVVDRRQSLSEMRFGLGVAIVLGGIISMAIMVVGTELNTISAELLRELPPEEVQNLRMSFSYDRLAGMMMMRVGPWAIYLLGGGMFLAGFSSMITAPLASALTAQSLFQNSKNAKHWDVRSRYFKLVWGSILLVGIGFGLANTKPEPAIVLAQALNGLILPLISVFLLSVVNDPKLMGRHAVNSTLSNILMSVVVWVAFLLGCNQVLGAVFKALGQPMPQGDWIHIVMALLTLFVSFSVVRKIYRRRRRLLAETELDKLLFSESGLPKVD